LTSIQVDSIINDVIKVEVLKISNNLICDEKIEMQKKKEE
jgi:hypothetical protein